MGMTSWKVELSCAMESHGETWDDVEKCTLSQEELEEKFDNDYGGTEGHPFTLWTHKYVYFPLCYDGAEWVGSAPRNPNGIALHHQGGG